MRMIWSALLAVLLSAAPAVEAATSAPTMACDTGGDKAAPSMTCMSCCLLPGVTAVLRALEVPIASLHPSVVAPLTGVEPKAASPPPRPVRV